MGASPAGSLSSIRDCSGFLQSAWRRWDGAVQSGPVTVRPEPYVVPLERAHHHARRWLASVGDRPIPPRSDVDTLATRVGGELPAGPVPPGEVVDLLAEAVEPGLMAMGSGRFYGWVIGGTLPAALAADWMVRAWDQNSGLRFATPGVVAAEEAAARWLLELLRLPAGAD